MRVLLLLAAGAVAMAGCTTPGPVDAGSADAGSADAPRSDVPALDVPASDAPMLDAPSAMDAGALTCAAYCTRILSVCTGANAQYGDEAECAAVCTGFTVGTLGDTTGDTLGCRAYHLENAAMSAAMATVHCPHAGPTGGGVCN